jgi:phosphoribosylanthranilate isomerase
MTVVKICGVRTFEDALFAAEHGADMLGLNFYARSPRSVTPDQARAIADGLRAQLGAACPLLVGLFVNEAVSTIDDRLRHAGLKYTQLSGDESAEILSALRGHAYKAIRPVNAFQAADDAHYYAATMPDNPRLPSLLIDASVVGAYGGTGHEVDDELVGIVKNRVPRLMLAGGLTPDNVAARVKAIEPWGVDVASGVESGGVQDQGKIRAFIEAVRSVPVP